MKVLVHICCSVDSHFFLQKMQKEYSGYEIIGFFYDPNIHPYSEYYLRLLDVKRSCKMLEIELIEGEYDYASWLNSVRGLEFEPEKGARCSVCFDKRFEVSAIKAKELGCNYFTSTLLTSPKKSIKQLKNSGEALGKKYGVEFLTLDYRSNSGTQEQNILAKQDKLYRQNYCGCMFGLSAQRKEQNKLEIELFSPLTKQILPGSIESRIKLFEKKVELEEQNRSYEIIKRRFLNWRLLSAVVMRKKKVLNSHILPYSTLRRGYSRGKVEKKIGEIYYFNRDEIKFIDLQTYNKLLKTDYKTVLDLANNAPSFEKELNLKKELLGDFDMSALIVLDEVNLEKLEIKIDSKTFEDVEDKLVC
jgi:predicted adenine nucleotide alpha hydrolase (AANH) superfamily ATPase